MSVIQKLISVLLPMLVLLFLAIVDKRRHRIDHRMLATCAGILLLCGCFREVLTVWRVGGLLLGVVVLLLCYFSKEALGFADGILILVMGTALGLYEGTLLCLFSMCYAALFAGGLMVLRKRRRKDRIAFLPFLLLGFVSTTLLTSFA